MRIMVFLSDLTSINYPVSSHIMVLLSFMDNPFKCGLLLIRYIMRIIKFD